MVEWGCDMRLERDGHTGLFSCEELTDYLRFLIENRKTVAVMLMDLDFFYNIARRIGREESERVLERIGGMLGEEKGSEWRGIAGCPLRRASESPPIPGSCPPPSFC